MCLPDTVDPRRPKWLQICKEQDLVATGGSDFHGPQVSAATLGSPTVPMASTLFAPRSPASLSPP